MPYQFKKSKEDMERGVDDWLMTYADMITLLLCFFAIFLSVSVPEKEAFVNARQKVLEKFSQEPGVTLAGDETKFKTGGNYDALPSILDRFHMDTTSLVNNSATGKSKDHKNKKEKADGDRILTLEMPSAAFFSSGSATLSEEGKALLLDILNTKLKAQELEDYQITIEGHTDDVPINTVQFPSNWELSTARAASVVRYFIEQGVLPQKLRASGYADSVPKVPNRDGQGDPIPENQAQNRRVLIKLEKVIKDNKG